MKFIFDISSSLHPTMHYPTIQLRLLIYSFISLIHSFIHSFIHSWVLYFPFAMFPAFIHFFHSLVHSLSFLPPSLPPSFLFPFICSFIWTIACIGRSLHSFFLHSLIPSLVHLRSFAPSYRPSFLHSLFIHFPFHPGD